MCKNKQFFFLRFLIIVFAVIAWNRTRREDDHRECQQAKPLRLKSFIEKIVKNVIIGDERIFYDTNFR